MTKEAAKINIAIADDHGLYRSGLVELIHSLSDTYKVIIEASNGVDLLEKVNNNNIDLIILDVDMPVLNGIETAKILLEKHPKLAILVITMLEEESVLINMFRIGVKGFLSKDVDALELKSAIDSISNKGFHYTDSLTGTLINVIKEDLNETNKFNDRELTFLGYCCSELTYKEIADKMYLSPKTIDGYRASLFEKLSIKSRVGLVMYAIKNKIVCLTND
jgi:DNA-binding NarL/FixJ family response regulator